MKPGFILFAGIVLFLFSACAKLKIRNDACDEAAVSIGNHSDSSYVWAPNIFTPNGDGRNDIFYVHCKKVENFRCTIKNGSGTKLFDSENYTVGWDGTHNGKQVKDGIYKIIVVATIDGQENEVESKICLLRATDKYCPGNVQTCAFDNQFGDYGYDPNNWTGEMICQ